MVETISIETRRAGELIDVTAQVQEVVEKSGVAEGVCVVFSPHTTAGLTLNSYLDPLTAADLVSESERLVPMRPDFKHQVDGPSDAAAHIKASLFGNSQTLIVSGGRLLLGPSQAVFFCEFDGPRRRQVHVRVQRDD